MEKFLHPTHPVRCMITGPTECRKSVFLTSLILNTNNESDKIYLYSPCLHQDLYQKLIKCFSNHIPIHMLLNILEEKNIDSIVD